MNYGSSALVTRLQQRLAIDQLVLSDSCASHPIFQFFIRPCVAEFLGSLAYTVLSSLTIGAELREDLKVLTIAFANSFSVVMLMSTFGHISGGHFNPAITLGVWLSGGMRFLLALFFVVCQVFGAFIGALLARATVSRDSYVAMLGGINDISTVVATSKGQAVLCELLLSTLLVLSYLCVVVEFDGRSILAPLAVGFAVATGTLASYHISRSSFNPARSFATATAFAVFSDGQWDYQYIYLLGPMIGALIASGIYKLLLAGDDKRAFFK